MSLLSALGFLSGAAQGRQKRMEDDQTMRYQTARDDRAEAHDTAREAELRREFDVQQANLAQQNATTVTEKSAADKRKDTLDGIGLVPPPEFFPPHNATPSERVRKKYILADWYEQHGALEAAKNARADASTIAASSYSLGARTDLAQAQTGLADANATFTSGARTAESASRTWLNYQRPQMENARLAAENMRQDKALGAAAQRQRAAFQQSQLLAGFNAQARASIASYAVDAHMKGVQDQDALRMAITEFTQADENFRAGNKVGVLPGSPMGMVGAAGAPQFAAPPMQAPMQPLTINVGTLPAYNQQGGGGGAAPPKPPGDGGAHDKTIDAAVASGKNARALGASPEALLKVVDGHAEWTPAQKAAIKHQLGIGGAVAPPPISARGPQGASLPFLLRQALQGT